MNRHDRLRCPAPSVPRLSEVPQEKPLAHQLTLNAVELSKPPELSFELVKRTDLRYKAIRDRHYVPNKGAHAQQLHFLIHYRGSVAGIISAGSAAYAVSSRDSFFNITKDNRNQVLNGLVDNTVFRLEYREPHLASRTLAAWRKITAELWEHFYGVEVYGFETFVVEESAGAEDQNGEVIESGRNGFLYRADGWEQVGTSAGSAKVHNGLATKATRAATDKKLIFCCWVKGHTAPILSEYKSSWRAETKEEKARAAALANKRKQFLGAKFFTFNGGQVYYVLVAEVGIIWLWVKCSLIERWLDESGAERAA